MYMQSLADRIAFRYRQSYVSKDFYYVSSVRIYNSQFWNSVLLKLGIPLGAGRFSNLLSIAKAHSGNYINMFLSQFPAS